MRFVIAVALLTACGGGGTPAPQAAPQAAPPTAPDPSPSASPPPDAIVSTEFDIAVAVPAGRENGTMVDQRATSWQLNHVDLDHTDGRMLSIVAAANHGGSALANARELRDQLATQDGNQCEQPEPAEFLGRDGARFTCVLGDGKGTWYFSATARCSWSAMISKRGPEDEYEPYLQVMLAKITVPSGAKAPNVEACF